MHEYTIVQALIDRVAEAARGYDAPRVTEVRVRIGELAGVETALLRKAYDVFRERTLCRDAPLVIESAAARWACPRCHRDVAAAGVLRCARCDRPAILVEGGEIVLERVAMEVQ
ncbi:MAG TPA: hydrogenase maturation nickel metallochaperone HypA [Thermoanaerobaculia bacterium]|nr:hydrogenase maturation nickel metallochaperone HypA [Thermoanaerobaculia bacterium]